ncbi:hypothetical protein, partial [Staphylococcus epidermidis]|uniref:hypothetical protein n=1 Tax=Staphylococcus epidermidis TaxID=1282 RepID=UPI003709BF1F
MRNGQKDRILNDTSSGRTRREVGEKIGSGKELNNRMKAVRDCIGDNNEVLESSKYMNEDS